MGDDVTFGEDLHMFSLAPLQVQKSKVFTNDNGFVILTIDEVK